MRGALALNQGDAQTAVRENLDASVAQPENHIVWYNLATAYLMAGDPANAANAAGHAVHLLPSGEYLLRLAQSQEAAGNRDDATKTLARIVESQKTKLVTDRQRQEAGAALERLTMQVDGTTDEGP